MNSRDKPKLKERQQRFVDYYIQSDNGAESARKAGYAPNSARVTAAQLLANPNVQEAIRERLKQLESERIAKTEEILRHITSTMRGDVEEEIVVNVGTGKGFTRPEKVKAKVGAKERLKAAELLAKVNGLFVTKQELDIHGSVPVVIKDDM